MSATDIAALSCTPDSQLPVMFDWANAGSILESAPIKKVPVDPRDQFIQDVERFYGALYSEVARRERQTHSIFEAYADVMAAGEQSRSAVRMCFTEVIKDSELARSICQILVSDHGRNRLRLDRRCDVTVDDLHQFHAVVLDAESESTLVLGPSFKGGERKAEVQRRRATVVPRLDVRAAAEFLIKNFSGEAGHAIAMAKVARRLAEDLVLCEGKTKFHETDGRVEIRVNLALAFMDKNNLCGGSQLKIVSILDAFADVLKDQGIDIPTSLHESLGRVRPLHGPQVMTRYDIGSLGYLKTFKKHGVLVMSADFANLVREFLSNYLVGQ